MMLIAAAIASGRRTMKISRPLLLAATTLTAFTLARAARADIIPANQTACQGKTVGDSCVDGQPGTCQIVGGESLRCYYPEGGVISVYPPSYAGSLCFSRIEGDPCSAMLSEDGGDSFPHDGICHMTPFTLFICVVGDAGAPAAAAAPTDGSCSLGAAHTARSVGPWLMAGSVSLLIAFGRRRRNR
jgi:hypothetical protein